MVAWNISPLNRLAVGSGRVPESYPSPLMNRTGFIYKGFC